MPSRIIKETIHTSDRVNAMSDFQFRLWVSLITYVDDYGRGDARPAVIKGACFPLRERVAVKDISAALSGLAGIGCVFLYEVGGKPYLCFPNWEKHQTIRNKRSKYPAPDLQAVEINCTQMQANVPVIQVESESNPNPKSKSKNAQTRVDPPTLEEVIAYCKERKSPVDPKKFWEYFEAGGWADSSGKPVRSWKQKLLTWEKFDTGRHPAPQGQAESPQRSPEDAAADHDRMARMMAALEAK